MECMNGSISMIRRIKSPHLKMVQQNWRQVEELFVEACSALDNDIRDSSDIPWFLQNICEKVLSFRLKELEKFGDHLVRTMPELTNMVSSRLSTVSVGLERLRIRHCSQLGDMSSEEENEVTAASHFRKWLKSISQKLAVLEAALIATRNANKPMGYVLDQLADEQQALQKQIQTKGNSLLQNVKRSIKRHSYQSKGEELHAQGDLKVLTQRWHQLWIQSLSLQCNIEREQRQLDQSEDATESDPELREPLIKKRKTVEKTHQSDDSLRSEEDVIPFYDDEYERFASESMENVPVSSELNISKIEPSDERFCAEPQPDIGYSSGDNSNQCSARNTSSGQTPPQVSLEGRIEASPAKGFYKTVALDDFGVTDTETPRICANTWPSSLSDPPVLSDSLIVNVDDVQDSVSQHDFEEVLSMLDGSDLPVFGVGDPQTSGSGHLSPQGTQWKELHSSRKPSRHFFTGDLHFPLISFGHRHSPKLQSTEIDKNSCDASSEESDDCTVSHRDACVMTNSLTDSQVNSLKRRHKSRCTARERNLMTSSLHKSSLSTFEQNMLASSLHSRFSDLPHDLLFDDDPMIRSIYVTPSSHLSNRSHNTVRRKLRARRLPRSMSDGEQIGLWMDDSMCSAPDAHACQSTSFQDNSDTTGPEQSDAQPYEWDDYKPPAKIEDGWCTDEQQDASSLTLEDDYQMQLGNEIHSLIAESRASLRSAASLLNRHPSHRSLEDLKTLATANADRLMIALSTIPEMNASNRCDIADISRQWKVLLSNIDALSNRCAAESTSLLIRMQPSHVESSDSGCSSPPILSKLEKFLSSSKLLLEDDDIDVSLSSLSPIKSLADVVNALHVCHDLRDRLIRKREEWNSLLRSGSLNELPDVIADSDYKSVSDAYEDVISKFEQLVEQVETVKQYWSDWTDTQKKLRSLMRDIESEIAQLRNGDVDSKHIRAELEMCQERMSRLETVCNYLTSGMSMLNDGSSVDFVSELTVYSNALLKLKTSFDEIMRSTGKSEKSVFVQTTRRRSRKSPPKTKSPSITVKPSLITSFGLAARESWILKGLILLSVFVAFFAWLTSFQSGVPNNWRNSFGPHLDYVNGPPLV